MCGCVYERQSDCHPFGDSDLDAITKSFRLRDHPSVHDSTRITFKEGKIPI
jgi:hypothetical protein